VGCPLMYQHILSRNAHKLFLDTKCEERYGFIYKRFEPQFAAHEVLEMLRKFMMTAVVALISPGTIDQTMSALMIATAFLVYQIKYQPFISDEEDNIQSASMVTTVITLALGVSMSVVGDSSFKTMLLMFVNVGTMIFVLIQAGFIGYESYKQNKKKIWTAVDDILNPPEESDKEKEREKARKQARMDRQRTKKMTDENATIDINPGNKKGLEDKGSEDDLLEEVVEEEEEDEGSFDKFEESETKTKTESEQVPDGPLTADQLAAKANDMIDKSFNRFDIDGSGALNSNEELKMLAMHVLFKLSKHVNRSAIEQVDTFPEVSDEDAWTKDDFKAWFKDEIITGALNR